MLKVYPASFQDTYIGFSIKFWVVLVALCRWKAVACVLDGLGFRHNSPPIAESSSSLSSASTQTKIATNLKPGKSGLNPKDYRPNRFIEAHFNGPNCCKYILNDGLSQGPVVAHLPTNSHPKKIYLRRWHSFGGKIDKFFTTLGLKPSISKTKFACSHLCNRRP